MEVAYDDAESLYKAGVAAWGTEESVFNEVFMMSSPAQLYAVCHAYKDLYQQDLTDAIRSEMSGDLKRAYTNLIESVRSLPTLYAKLLYSTMEGMGTNDRALIRILVSRSERDLQTIADEFQLIYKKSVASMVDGDTSGDYGKLLLAILSPQPRAESDDSGKPRRAPRQWGPTPKPPAYIKRATVKPLDNFNPAATCERLKAAVKAKKGKVIVDELSALGGPARAAHCPVPCHGAGRPRQRPEERFFARL